MMTRQRLVFIFVIFIALLVGACGGPSTQPKSAATTLTVGLTSDPSSLDPANSGDGASYAAYHFALEDLFVLTQNHQINPVLATDWKFSTDAKTLVVHLRRNVKFQDGSPFNATAIKANFDRILNPSLKLLARSYFSSFLGSVQVVDDYTVQFNLLTPKPSFIYDLADTYTGLMSAASLARSESQISVAPVGTGPFRIIQWQPHQQITLNRFSGYWGQPAGVDKLILKPIPEEASRIAALQAGDVDVALNPTIQDVQRLSSNSGYQLLSTNGAQAFIYELDLRKRPLSDIRVRQALNYAIDKNAIVKQIYGGLAIPLDSVFAPSTIGYTSVGTYQYDPARARQLLAEAGYGNGLQLTLWSPTGYYLDSDQLNQAVAGYLRAVGVNVNIVNMDNATFLNRIFSPPPNNAAPQYDLALLNAQSATGDADALWQFYILKSSWPPNGVNIAFYSNPQVDALVAKVTTTIDPAQRNALDAQIETIVWHDAPWIFVLSPEQLTLAKKGLSGTTFTYYGLDLSHARLSS